MLSAIIGVIGAILASTLTGMTIWVYQTRKSKKKTDDQTAIIAAAGHALRSHLNSILGQSQLLLARSQNYRSQDRHLVESVLGAGGDLRRILLDTLDIVEVKTGKLKVSNDERLLHDMLSEIVSDHKVKAERCDVSFDATLRASTLGWFMYDEVRVRQCVNSILGQCFHQATGGSVKLSAAVKKKGRTGHMLQITVVDPGAEIHQYQADAYFSPRAFFRNPHLESESAWRLSVLLARLVARKMNGDIKVTSKYDGDLAFRLNVPVTFVKKARIASGADKGAENTTSNEPPNKTVEEYAAHDEGATRLLIADDDATNLMVLEGLLRACGYENITSVSDGAQILDQLAAQAFDIVVTDIQMPTMSGLTATQAIRASDKAWADIPIVAVSGALTAETRSAVREAGANAFIAKPVFRDELYVVLKEQLDKNTSVPRKDAA